MARGIRREVRNDLPGVGESRETMLQRTRDDYFNRTKPSANKPKHRREVPAGCFSVYRVKKWDGKRTTYYGVFREEDMAFRVADDEWDKVVKPWSWSRDGHVRVEVEHKAAVLLDGRFFLVNLDPIRFTEPPAGCVLVGGAGVPEVSP
jgi:hypothetical protein